MTVTFAIEPALSREEFIDVLDHPPAARPALSRMRPSAHGRPASTERAALAAAHVEKA
jgi:hypothetical protein